MGVSEAASAMDMHAPAASGKSTCPCIGMVGQLGKYNLEQYGSVTADFGGECWRWDRSNNPDCKGPDAPAWCEDSWCFVDPCQCQASQAPKPSLYSYVKFMGHPLFFSYDTCG